ncbi:MAG: extracellular solute-binding protein [Chloroflexota bacterium]|nr:extracellular solute-binding protein [Chloroflexota bacterium]
MRDRFGRLAALGAVAVLAVGACGGSGGSDWSAAADAGRAKDQAKTVSTYGAPDDWANYGEQFKQFCMKNWNVDCNTDHERSLGEDMSSAEEITAFDAEKNAPKAALADIGIMFAGAAEQKGVLAPYVPKGAENLPADLKGKDGGWIATFVGVPGYVVNVDFLTSKGVAVPTTWADLAKPEYKGFVGFGKPGSSGTATMAFVAMNLAAGGTLDDYAKGVELGKGVLANLASSEGNADSFEKGEVPIQIKYDFNLIALSNAMKGKGVAAQVVIPADGSIYAPSAIIANKYDTAHMDFTKLFLDWILSDEGQTIFAKFGARPIRSVVGDTRLVVPADAKTLWLPDDQYTQVQVVDVSRIDLTRIQDIWVNQVGGAG